ncbi:GNAT family N-acetyltransferase [Sorangium sp. So ce1128]
MTVESLAMRWWNLDWRAYLPLTLGDVTVELGTLADAESFIRAHYPGMFAAPDGASWLADPMTEAKRRFYHDADIFLFRDCDRSVGLQIGHPIDWSTYYVRTVALLPEHRGRGLLAGLTAHVANVLAGAGVERIEGDIPPTNMANLLAQTRLGYVATGTLNSDRWGLLVRMTKYLRDDADAVFRRQYCAVAWPRRPPT